MNNDEIININHLLTDETNVVINNDENIKVLKKKKKNSQSGIENYNSKIQKICEEIMLQEIKQNKLDKSNNIEIDNTYIPKINEYSYLTKNKYNVDKLKLFSRTYKLKVSGNKNELLKRLYSFMRLSFYITKIQKVFRGNLQRKYIGLHGPALYKRDICTNNSDFFTMEELKDIDYLQFFSYKDIDGYIYGFDIISLYNLISKTENKREIRNPYNRIEIPKIIIHSVRYLLRLSKVFKHNIEIDIKDITTEISPQKSIELRTIGLFQKIDSLGNYSDPVWFLSLSRIELIRLVRELMDIWDYRAQITTQTKRAICPPHGELFRHLSLYYLQNETQINNIRKILLDVFEKLINSGIDTESKSLGAIYILGSLTLVNSNAAIALPWLYQTFSYF